MIDGPSKKRCFGASRNSTATRRVAPDSVVADLIPESFISALIHDAQGDPIDATNRRRHPNRRQKRLVKERDRTCVDCGRSDLLEYDHVPAYETTGHTITTELEPIWK